MTGQYYGEVLTNLRQAVKERWRGILTQGLLLLHGNAPAHMSQVAQAIGLSFFSLKSNSPVAFLQTIIIYNNCYVAMHKER